MIDDEQRVHEDYRDKVQKAERKANDALGELEDLRASLEQVCNKRNSISACSGIIFCIL